MHTRISWVLGLIALSSVGFAATINVPAGQPTITAAIAAAAPGDTIQVAAGTYNENIVVNKRLIIQGAGASTIINGGGGIAVVYTVGGASASSRQILRDLRVEAQNHGISVRGDVGFFTFDRLSIVFTGSLLYTTQMEGIGFANAAGTFTPFGSGTPANQNDVVISNSLIKDYYQGVIIHENMNDFRLTGTRVIGGWFGMFLDNGNTTAFTTNRITNNLQVDRCLFYDQGIKGYYAERGSNVTIETSDFLFCGNRSNRSLPTTDPRGLAGGGGGVGNGIDINLCGSGPMQNINIRNVTVAYCAIRDRELASDPPGAGGLSLSAGISVKGRIARGGSSITNMNIVNSTIAHNRVGIGIPQTDGDVAGTIGVTKGNVIFNANISNCNIYGNVARAIHPEGNATLGAAPLIFGSPTNVGIIVGYPTAGAWGTAGMQPVQLSGGYMGHPSGPNEVPSSTTLYAGTGDGITDGVVLNGFLDGSVATLRGRPVDLTGTYTGPSSGPVGASSQPGRGAASTGNSLVGTKTFEMSGTNTFGDNADQGTFQPFNELVGGKAPQSLALPNPVNSTTFTIVVQLNDPSNWNGWRWGGEFAALFATGDTFTVGISNALNSAGVQFVKDFASGDFRARMASENFANRTTFADGTSVVGSLAGNDATSPTMPGSTRFQVTVIVRGNELEGWVTPQDGSLAGQAQYLGTISKTNMTTNSPWTLVIDNTVGFPNVPTYYGAGFLNLQTPGSLANANVESFRSSQDPNVFSVWANDPYVKGSEPISYLFGNANMTTAAYGYQGSMSAFGATTVTGFGVTDYPFPQVLLAPTTGALHYAAGVATNIFGTDFDQTLAELVMGNPGGNGVASLTALNTFFGSFVARYSDGNGDPLPSLTNVSSNTVVVDNIAPTITPNSVTLLPGTNIPLVGGTLVTGGYRLVSTATDAGASPSGLETRPTYEWDFGNNGSIEIGPTPMNSGTGNAFTADFNVPNSATNGTAKLTIRVVDRAGNTTSTDVFFTVNTTTVTINFTVPNVPANVWTGDAVWVHVRLGGDGITGSNPVLDYHRSVVIGPGGAGQLVLNALNTSGATLLPQAPNDLSQYSVKVMPYSLRFNGGLVGATDKVGNAGALRFGDANGDNIVDILDYALYAVRYNQSETPAPVGLTDGTAPNGDGVLLPLASRRADFSGNGLVFTEDFTFFFPFPSAGHQLALGPSTFRPGPPRLEMTIDEAIAAGVPKATALIMDADKNRVITIPEIDAYLKALRGGRH